MRNIVGAAVLIAAAATGPAFGQDSPVVVELFTSQGCSSCPPADAVLAELAGRDDVIALALHVDYWDYIGWVDDFADQEHTVRQYDYANAAQQRVVYTPQMMIGGLDSIIGTDTMALMDSIATHAAARPTVRLGLMRRDDVLSIDAEALAPVDGPLTVQMVRYIPQQTVDIGHGENAGETISYANIVTSWETIGTWDGRERFAMDLAVSGTDPVVVIVQRAGPGLIVAAARLR